MQTFQVAVMMKGIVFCGMLLSACGVSANSAQDFQFARKLYYGGKVAEAEEAFRGARGAESVQASDGREHGTGGGVCPRAEEIRQGQGIRGQDRGPVFEQILSNQHLCEARVAGMTSLPCARERILRRGRDALIYDALLWRGKAYAVKRDCLNAEKNFIGAARHTVLADNKAIAYQCLGDLCRDISKNEEKALDAYEEVVKLGDFIPVRRLAAAAIARARLLAARGKGAEALVELDRLKADPDEGSSLAVRHSDVLCGNP